MLKKALWVMIPFLLIFLLGLFLLLRPQYQVPIVEVVDTFTRQEKTGQRSPHRHTVAYATVKVALDGGEHEVTVHDNTWKPLKSGDSVIVTRGLFGKIVEYRTRSAYRLMVCAATMGPACLLLFWIIAKRKNAGDRRGRGS
jgi:preprotein translocase subunit YajC